METKKTRAKGAGRKPKAPEERAKNTAFRLTEAHYKKFMEIGGVKWLREYLDKA
ncbi:MAG: hypothetical protein ABL903_07490 [Methylococcales bacterium]